MANNNPLGELTEKNLHDAAEEGDLLKVMAILKINPGLLNKTDTFGQTALLWAAIRGREWVVNYLLKQEGVDVDAVPNIPNNPGHGLTALQWAIKNKHYSSANFIIHKTLNEKNKDSIFDFITSAKLAFKFMTLDPRNVTLIFNNPRIKALITAWPKASEQHFLYFQPAKPTRRTSFYAEIDKETGQPVVFNKGTLLGKGVYGQVFDFISDKNEHRAVKYPQQNYNGENDDTNKCKKELFFRHTAYPGTNSWFFFRKDKDHYSLRSVMEYIDGKTLEVLFKNFDCLNTIGQIFLSIIKEILQLHEKNIIHGDLKANNIMITTNTNTNTNTNRIRIVDFGHSYWLSEATATTFPCSSDSYQYIAPERFVKPWSMLSPNTNQDVYSLGWMFNSLLSKHPIKIEIETMFPSLRKFIDAAVSLKPGERPLLTGFYEELYAECVNPVVEQNEERYTLI